jgi:hypothetical protein
MLDAVLVGHGLGAVAELAAAECGGPVALIVPPLDVAAGSAGAEASLPLLRSYALERSGGRVVSVPQGVAAEVPIRSGDELVGVVLLLGAAVVDELCVERLRLAAVAALTEIALAQARAAPEPDAAASATLLQALAGGETLSREAVVRRAAGAGCDLRGGAVAVCCLPHVERPHHVAALVRDDWPGALAEHLEPASGAARLWALLPARAGPGRSASGLGERLARHGPVGLSAMCADPAGLGRALVSAGLALDLGAARGAPADGPPWAVRVAEAGPVREHYEATIAPLIRYDGVYDTDLVRTLKLVIGAAGDTDGVAAGLGVPAHRVRYRMEKVRELCGLDPGAPEDRRVLALGVRCWRVVAPGLRG